MKNLKWSQRAKGNQMKNNENLKTRYATLDDVPKLLDHPGEFEFSTKYLHEAIRSSRQGIIILEENEEIKAFVHVRRGAEGIKIDSYGFRNKEEIIKLLSEVESLTIDLPIYIYVDKKDKDISLFKKAGYKEELETEDGQVKLVKPWLKIHEDRKKELIFKEKAEEARKQHEKIYPISKGRISNLESNLIILEKIIEEMREEEKEESSDTSKESKMEKKEDLVSCPICGDEFETERGMKIHKTKMHGSS